MNIETKELVNVIDDNGTAVHPGDMVIIAYQQNVPDTIAKFVGLGKAQTIVIECGDRQFRIRQSSIKNLTAVMKAEVSNEDN